MDTLVKRPPFWTTLTDSGGTSYSWARVACSTLLGAAIIWGFWIVYYKTAIPDFTSVAVLFGAIYGLNRAGEVTQQIFEKKEQTKQQEIKQDASTDSNHRK